MVLRLWKIYMRKTRLYGGGRRKEVDGEGEGEV
jgi:hypothetical protein